MELQNANREKRTENLVNEITIERDEFSDLFIYHMFYHSSFIAVIILSSDCIVSTRVAVWNSTDSVNIQLNQCHSHFCTNSIPFCFYIKCVYSVYKSDSLTHTRSLAQSDRNENRLSVRVQRICSIWWIFLFYKHIFGFQRRHRHHQHRHRCYSKLWFHVNTDAFQTIFVYKQTTVDVYCAVHVVCTQASLGDCTMLGMLTHSNVFFKKLCFQTMRKFSPYVFTSFNFVYLVLAINT